MEIHHRSVTTATEYALPTVRFGFEFKYGRSQEALTNIYGKLSINGKIIGALNLESQMPASNLQAMKYRGEQRDLGEVSIEVNLVSILSRPLIEIIEKSRRNNKNGDVEFNLSIVVNYLSNLAEISHIVSLPLQNVSFSKQSLGEICRALGLDPQKKQIEFIFHAYQERNYYQNNSNLMFVSENAEAIGNQPRGGYLMVDSLAREFNVRVSASDWINDFAPALGLGEFFVVEIPIGDKTIKEAWDLISRAEESFRRWNIEGVMSSCRLVGQNLDGLLKKKFGEESFTYRERWERIYGSGKMGFTSWASMPLHSEEIKNEGTGGRKYDKSQVIVTEADAEAILLTTKTLIKYAEKLVNENSYGEILNG